MKKVFCPNCGQEIKGENIATLAISKFEKISFCKDCLQNPKQLNIRNITESIVKRGCGEMIVTLTTKAVNNYCKLKSVH
jgi:hypothetical protein